MSIYTARISFKVITVSLSFFDSGAFFIELYGSDRHMHAYYKMQDDGMPLMNDNGLRALTPMTEEEVKTALEKGEYLFALN